MVKTPLPEINIEYIIKNENITTCFQPVVSIKKKTIVGFEALSRGVTQGSKNIIPPEYLFSLANKKNLCLELDRLCRKSALRNFKRGVCDEDLMLFLNFDTSILDRGVTGSGHLQNLVDNFGINPGNVVLEIVESNVRDIHALKKFIKIHRNKGFLIALDDVGNGHSNLNRIPMVKPDILKIDRYLVRSIDKDYHKQAVCKSLIDLARSIGTLVIAEGVESEEEAITVLELGVDMIQGYYFCQPGEIPKYMKWGLGDVISKLGYLFQDHLYKKFYLNKREQEVNSRIISDIISKLSILSLYEFDNTLFQFVKKYPALECIYVLNEKGIQLSITACNGDTLQRSHMPIFRPALKGEDHSLKDYYYSLMNSNSKEHTTEPYISLSSGNLCITVSKVFTGSGNKTYILCADFTQKGEAYEENRGHYSPRKTGRG